MSVVRQFQRLVRFVGSDNLIHYGDAILPTGVADASAAKEAFLIVGNPFAPAPQGSGQAYTVTGTRVAIKKLLAPIAPEHVQTVRCLGLNYRKHAQELALPFPKFPVLFYKPKTALGGPSDDLVVPRVAQLRDADSDTDATDAITELDYEVELVIVIGNRPARDVPLDKALDYVLGYTVGNDYSHRVWQTKRGGGQWNLGKMYDGWAPVGPAIVSSRLIRDPQQLAVQTRVNGNLVQDGSTSDMIFSVAQAVSFLSQGSTLLPGDLIFTGTPSGVGAGRTPHLWLKHGDIVSVSLSEVGTVTNKIIYEKPTASKL